MARPQRVKIVPTEDRAAYERWLNRVLSWPAAVDPEDGRLGLLVKDMPGEYQDRFIENQLVRKALRSGPDHWSRSMVEIEDL